MFILAKIRYYTPESFHYGFVNKIFNCEHRENELALKRQKRINNLHFERTQEEFVSQMTVVHKMSTLRLFVVKPTPFCADHTTR